MLLATNFIPPATRSPGVVMVVHDLAYERLPETAPHMDDRWRRRFDGWLRRAAGVLVPSNSTKRDLLEAHPVGLVLECLELVGVPVANDRKVLLGGSEVLAHGQHLNAILTQLPDCIDHLLERFTETDHQPGLGRDLLTAHLLGQAQHPA